MSGKVMGAIFGLELSRPKREVLQAMADHADDDGNGVRPSMALIAWKTDYTERHVRRIVKLLLADGLLVLVSNPKGRVNEYRINLAAGKPKKEFHEPRTSESPGSGSTPDIIVSGVPLTSGCPGSGDNSGHHSVRGSENESAKMSGVPRTSESPGSPDIQMSDDPSITTNITTRFSDRPKNGRSDAEPVLEPQADPPPDGAKTDKPVQPHIALIDGYLEALDAVGRKPVETDHYKRRVRIATAMQKAGITPEQVRAFVLDIYAHDSWWREKTKPIPLERIGEQLPSWLSKERDGPPAPTRQAAVPGRTIEGADVLGGPRIFWTRVHDDFLRGQHGYSDSSKNDHPGSKREAGSEHSGEDGAAQRRSGGGSAGIDPAGTGVARPGAEGAP